MNAIDQVFFASLVQVCTMVFGLGVALDLFVSAKKGHISDLYYLYVYMMTSGALLILSVVAFVVYQFQDGEYLYFCILVVVYVGFLLQSVFDLVFTTFVKFPFVTSTLAVATGLLLIFVLVKDEIGYSLKSDILLCWSICVCLIRFVYLVREMPEP